MLLAFAVNVHSNMALFGVSCGSCCLDLRVCLGEALAVEVQGGSDMCSAPY
jgi:hypothetical protein